jgi:hypothetical protein
MKILINLIGEQPIPNLLPILHLKPEKTIVLYSEKTAKVARRLKNIVKNCERFEVDAYSPNSIDNILDKIVNETDEFIFNITGGTKLMSVALFNFGMKFNSQIIYLKSEGKKNLIYYLKTDSKGNISYQSEELPELIDVDTYLKAHLRNYLIVPPRKAGEFGIRYENAVVDVLESNNFEVIRNVKPMGEGQQVEIDAVFRPIGTNNVGIAEIKVGDYKMERPKKGIDQLSTAGSREYLGIYTKKFLITKRKLFGNLKKAAEVHGIVVIDGIRMNSKYEIIDADKKKLVEQLLTHLT